MAGLLLSQNLRRCRGFHSLSLRVFGIVCLQNKPQATQELLRLIKEKASEVKLHGKTKTIR